MSTDQQVRVELAAARALAQWKASFADEVCARAVQLAAASGQPNDVTLDHYRQAASLALPSLLATIRDGVEHDAARKAA